MDRALIERLAREAGRHEVSAEHRLPHSEHGSFVASVDWVLRFAGAVAEECAKIADSMRIEGAIPDSAESERNYCAAYVAEEIRAKFTSPGQNLLNPGDRKEEPAVREGAAL